MPIHSSFSFRKQREKLWACLSPDMNKEGKCSLLCNYDFIQMMSDPVLPSCWAHISGRHPSEQLLCGLIPAGDRFTNLTTACMHACLHCSYSKQRILTCIVTPSRSSWYHQACSCKVIFQNRRSSTGWDHPHPNSLKPQLKQRLSLPHDHQSSLAREMQAKYVELFGITLQQAGGGLLNGTLAYLLACKWARIYLYSLLQTVRSFRKETR